MDRSDVLWLIAAAAICVLGGPSIWWMAAVAAFYLLPIYLGLRFVIFLTNN